MKILKSCDAIFNKQECIVIMLFCLNHGHSEHKQKADMHGYSIDFVHSLPGTKCINLWLQLLKYGNLYGNITLSHCPDKLICYPLLQQMPMHGVVIKWCCQAWFISTMSWFSPGGPLAAKQTIHGSYSWSGGPVVVGDHLQCNRSMKIIFASS